MKTVSDYLKQITKKDYSSNAKNALLKYMTDVSFLSAASTAKITDPVTGERVIDRCRLIFSDGEYEWRSEETYLLEKYDLELSGDFIQHVIQQSGKRSHHGQR